LGRTQRGKALDKKGRKRGHLLLPGGKSGLFSQVGDWSDVCPVEGRQCTGANGTKKTVERTKKVMLGRGKIKNIPTHERDLEKRRNRNTTKKGKFHESFPIN